MRPPMPTRPIAWSGRATCGFRGATCVTTCPPSATRLSTESKRCACWSIDGTPARLITLVGVGGTGKTRFASRGARRQLGEWPGGVYFCDLSESRTLEGVVRAVAMALDTPLSANDPVVQIGHAIAGRGRCLMILDNFEQVVDIAAATLGRWLDRAAEAAFLVTSRQRLQLRGEEVFALETLRTQIDATELFVDRARAHDPSFVLDDQNRATIGRITDLVEGLPLAIELAAARVRMLTPTQLLERLSSQFQLLGSARGSAARQATLKATIDWSWQLLLPWEQAALAQCSVFEGSFTLEAAEAVIDASRWPDAPLALDIMQALVDKDLLRRAPASAFSRSADEILLGMYVSVHEFAAEQLTAAGSAARTTAEIRHGRFYAAFGSREALEALEQHGGARKRLALARDLGNIVPACRRATQRNDADIAVPTYRTIGEVVHRQGPFSLAESLGTQLLERVTLSPVQRAEVESIVGSASMRMGVLLPAQAAFERALALARAFGDAYVEGRVLSSMSWLEELQGRSRAAHELADQVLAVHRQAGDLRSEGTALTSLAYFAFREGRLDDSQALYEKALALQRSMDNERDECSTLWRFAVLLAEQGRLQQAREHFERALQISQQLEDRVAEGQVLTNLGTLRQEQGDIDEATHCFERALAIHREAGNRRWEACALGALGLLQFTKGLLNEAEHCTEQALAIAREIGDRMIEGSELANLGEVLMRQGRLEEARKSLAASEAILRSVGAHVYLGLMLCVRAELEVLVGDLPAARAARDEARGMAATLDLGADAALVQRIDKLTPSLDTTQRAVD